jgi:hypothetical protein
LGYGSWFGTCFDYEGAIMIHALIIASCFLTYIGIGFIVYGYWDEKFPRNYDIPPPEIAGVMWPIVLPITLLYYLLRPFAGVGRGLSKVGRNIPYACGWIGDKIKSMKSKPKQAQASQTEAKEGSHFGSC